MSSADVDAVLTKISEVGQVEHEQLWRSSGLTPGRFANVLLELSQEGRVRLEPTALGTMVRRVRTAEVA